MRRTRFVALVFAVLAVFTAIPAGAITDGELDGNGHPAVVLILMEVDGVPAFRCSGTLIAPRFVLTAGHCAGAPGEFSGIRVFTESDVQNGHNNYPYAGPNAIEAVHWAAHPLYPTASFVLHDVGMIELAKPVKLKSYGTLPAAGSLDGLAVGTKTTFTSVGYGLQAAFPDATNWKEIRLRIRMVANPHLLQIDTGFTGDFSMLLSNNHSTGGTCFGDSGGPNFLGASMVVAAVTSYGINTNCAGTGGVFRLDKADVLAFINGFMANPYTP
jgi:secreted trypsin-like serine protease